jgi:magnesium-transporting ATPase (P-type)
MMCFALIFSALPVVIYGLSEQPSSSESLLRNPSAYRKLRGNAMMGSKAFGWWTFLLLWHTAIIFYLPKLVWSTESREMDWGFFSHFLSGIIVAVSDMKVR